jgi:phytoene dehydrogenase-like protein
MAVDSTRTEIRIPSQGGTRVAQRYDAVIIGGGHNGLTTAAYLAKAGWKTLVLEKRRILGGATTSDEIVPGYTFSVLSYVVSLLRPEIIRDLELAKHGLEILPLDGTFTPLHGDYLWRTDDHAQTMRQIRRWSATDADAYEEYGQLMADMARFIKPILGMVPPDPTSIDPRDWLGVLGLGRDFARLPERQQSAFIGLMTMSAADFLDQWFETEPLKATMSASGIIGTFLGVRSPGTAYVLLHHYMGEIDGAFRAWGLHKGGTGAISAAIASAARSHGAEIRTDAGVSRVTLTPSGDRATGVVLESGEEIAANVVVSSADVRRTFLQFLEPGILPGDFEAQVRRFKFRGSSGKVNLALDALPTFTTNPGGTEYLRGAVSISPSLEHMERAYDEAKYGRFSRRPYVDIVFPSLVDPSVAPPGRHVMSCFVQYAPYNLAEGPADWDNQKEAFGDAVIDLVSEFAPNLKDVIVERHVVSPLDMERDWGLTEGNIFHGELSLEQLFFSRPIPGWARYRTPIRDYWMCGSSTHPGGGIMGANGRLAALELIRARRTKVA